MFSCPVCIRQIASPPPPRDPHFDFSSPTCPVLPPLTPLKLTQAVCLFLLYSCRIEHTPTFLPLRPFYQPKSPFSRCPCSNSLSHTASIAFVVALPSLFRFYSNIHDERWAPRPIVRPFWSDPYKPRDMTHRFPFFTPLAIPCHTLKIISAFLGRGLLLYVIRQPYPSPSFFSRTPWVLFLFHLVPAVPLLAATPHLKSVAG